MVKRIVLLLQPSEELVELVLVVLNEVGGDVDLVFGSRVEVVIGWMTDMIYIEYLLGPI